jgi:hypothetical protein
VRAALRYRILTDDEVREIERAVGTCTRSSFGSDDEQIFAAQPIENAQLSRSSPRRENYIQ